MKEKLQAANTVETTEELATPKLIKINLQLFAEGDPVPPSDPEPSPSDDPTPSDPTPNNDPVPQPTPEPQPSNEPTQTQAFAHRLKEETTKARDAVIAELGYVNPTTGQPIKTYAEYQQVLKDKEYQEQYGIDPNTVKPLFEEWKQSDPDFQELSRLKQERIIEQQDTALKNDPIKGDLYKQWETEVKTQAKTIGCDLRTSFLLMLENKLGDVLTGAKTKAEQTAIQKIATNGASSPGSLGEGSDGSKTFFTKEEVKAMSQAEVSKNYDKICESMKKW